MGRRRKLSPEMSRNVHEECALAEGGGARAPRPAQISSHSVKRFCSFA